MNENTEVRDELARLAGWKRTGNVWVHGEEQVEVDDHPIPNTLDHAAKLPEGWFWSSLHDRSDGAFRATACRSSNAIGHEVGGMWKESEKTARFETRLAVEKIEHERKAK